MTLPSTVITPTHGLAALRLRELWEYRDLLFVLAWRDIQVRYKQMTLGILWSVMPPLVNVIFFSVMLGKLAKLPSDGLPYIIYAFSGQLAWMLFSGALERASRCLVANSGLWTKVYFPRLILPLSAIVSGLIDFAISLLLFFVLLAYFHIPLTWAMLMLPVFILLTLLCATAVGLWFAALTAQYRDMQYLITFILTGWMYLSPVVYSAKLVHRGIWHTLYTINPMVGVIQGFRWALLGSAAPGASLVVSMLVMLGLLVTGLHYFKAVERTCADII